MALLDVDLPLLEEIAGLLDAHLDRLNQEAAADPETADALVFDRMEHAVGLGFVACQNYIWEWVRILRLDPGAAFEKGPRHRCGEPIAALVNAAANYWKHRPEFEGEPRREERWTVELLTALGVSTDDYRAALALREILRPLPIRFGTLMPFLVAWRDELAAAARRSR